MPRDSIRPTKWDRPQNVPKRKGSLPPLSEWYFGDCPQEKLVSCFIYEYARSSPWIVEAVKSVKSGTPPPEHVRVRDGRDCFWISTAFDSPYGGVCVVLPDSFADDKPYLHRAQRTVECLPGEVWHYRATGRTSLASVFENCRVPPECAVNITSPSLGDLLSPSAAWPNGIRVEPASGTAIVTLRVHLGDFTDTRIEADFANVLDQIRRQLSIKAPKKTKTRAAKGEAERRTRADLQALGVFRLLRKYGMPAKDVPGYTATVLDRELARQVGDDAEGNGPYAHLQGFYRAFERARSVLLNHFATGTLPLAAVRG